MIESGGTPTVGAVTSPALCAKAARMGIIVNMTGGAIHGRALEQIILMAICTGGCCMFAIEFEGKLRVVNFGGFPAIRCMAGGALCSELPGVSIILKMAGGTIHGRAFEQVILMTIRASHR